MNANLQEMKNRKGAVKISDIPTPVLEQLNLGTIPTVNLVEWLAIDQSKLVQNTLPKAYIVVATDAINQLKNVTALQAIKVVGKAIYNQAALTKDDKILPYLVGHHADMLRCWACIYIGEQKQDIALQLDAIFTLATDQHFGVREISWVAIRDQLMEEFTKALPILKTWVKSENAYLRRFAIESIRPKGVWCKQFKLMQQQPELALPLLDALQTDPHKYVQDSVANWLNDASKSKPDVVQSICKQWSQNNPASKATAYIVKRALRSL